MGNGLVAELMEKQIDIACPNCLAAPEVSLEKVVCPECKASFDVADGIPVLRQNPETYYGEFPKDEMQRLLESASEDLEKPIRDYLRQRDAPPRLGEYILGRGRAGWQYLLPLNRDSKVLDLGCSWGTLAWSLAQFCGHVVACDSTLERMRLLGIRRRLDQLKNLQLVCAGDSKHLPFPENSFDAVVVNGVLEWVPSGLPGNPREVQKEFLKEVRRVLKPDGCLFLGIENRYAWKTWAMNADGHTGLRFVPWLPRTLAHLYSRLKGKGSYRNYLYGPGQYRRLLAECGFANTELHVPFPGYHHPVRMIKFEDKEQLERAFSRKEDSAFRQFRQRVKGLLSARFPDAFGMVANDQKRESFLDQLLSHVREEIGARNSSERPKYSYRMNGEMGIVTVLVQKSGDPFVLKLPIHKRGHEELRTETAILRQVSQANHPLETEKDLFARVIANGEFGRQEFFAYSVLPGVSGDRLPKMSARFGKAIENAAGFLSSLHAASPDQRASLVQLVEPLRERVMTLTANSEQRDTLSRVAGEVLEVFEGSFKGAVWSHGDSKLANFMFDPRTAALTGVIDWGTGFQPELPLYDLSFLFVSSQAAREGTSLPHQLRDQYRNGLPQRFRVTWDRYLASTGLRMNDAQYRALVGYQWMKRLAPLTDEYESMRFNHRYLDAMFGALA